MKKILAILLCLALTLSAAAFAEGSDPVQGIFERLLEEDSAYSQSKGATLEYAPETKYTETLNENGFTIAIEGNEYFSGSWDFVREGDYLTLTVGSNDFGGLGMIVCVMDAAGRYLGMNPSKLTAYINSLSAIGADSEYYRIENNDADQSTKFSLYIAGPYDMKEMDTMVMDDNLLNTYDAQPLGEESLSQAMNFGKVVTLTNGNQDGIVMLVGEYDGLDDIALQDVLCLMKALQPAGWEAFTAEYTALADAETENYRVKVNAETDEVLKIIEDPNEDCSYMIIRMGTELNAEPAE